MKTHLLCPGLMALVALSSHADEKATSAVATGSVLDIFPPSGLTFNTSSKTPASSCTFDYTPAGSKWTAGISEKDVFLASMKGDGWTLGVGKGGQIYSLRGAYGESVPPQRVTSPWNDEVWQAVATNEDLITPIHDYQNADHEKRYKVAEPLMYFIHQAGIYTPGADKKDASKSTAFYSPCLRKDWDPETRTLRLVNWMQQAHTPCVWKSGILIYTAFKDLGDGVLEVNQILHNFGDESLNYFSAPWGGVRKTSLPQTIVSKKDGTWTEEEGTWDWGHVPQRDLVDTAGWKVWAKNLKNESSPSLGFIFGKGLNAKGDKAEGKRIVLYGKAGVASRDYQVTEISAQLRVNKGESLSMRWYLVSNTLEQVHALEKKLTPKAWVSRHQFDASPMQPLFLDGTNVNTEGKGTQFASLHAFPLKDTIPVFLLKDERTGKQLITTDLYALAESEPYPNPIPKEHPQHDLYKNRVIYRQYAPHIGYENLLGYAYPKSAENRTALVLPEGAIGDASTKELFIGK